MLGKDALNTPRSRRQTRTRQAILDAAFEIVRTQGVQALSMRGLADKIDYRAASLYEYFENKEAILAAMCAQGYARLAESMGKVQRERSPRSYMVELGLAYLRFAVENPDEFMLIFAGAPAQASERLSKEEVEARGGSFLLIVHTVERGLEDGVWHARPGQSAVEIAFGAWALVHGIAMLRVTSMRNVPFDEDSYRRILMTYLAGLQARVADRQGD